MSPQILSGDYIIAHAASWPEDPEASMPQPIQASQTIRVEGLEVHRVLHDFVNDEAIPGTGIEAGDFWRGFASLVRRLSPRNAELLAERDRLQAQIDAWHRRNRGRRIRPRSLPRVSGRDRLPRARGRSVPDIDRERRCRDRRHRRPPAGRSGRQRPVCAECRQCALGKPLRRALRNRRDFSRAG